jgi:hypothetical protein
MPNKKKTITLKKFIPWKRSYLILVLIILFGSIALIVYFGVAWYQGYKFKQVEKKMDKLQTAFVDTLGKPLYQTKKESCGYSSVEFGRGRLSCGFNLQSVYKVKDGEEASKKVMTLQQVALNDKTLQVKKEKKPGTDFVGGDSPMLDSVWSTFSNINGTSSCEVSYYYIKYNKLKNYPDYSYIVSSKLYGSDILSVVLSCGTDPYRPIFNVGTT